MKYLITILIIICAITVGYFFGQRTTNLSFSKPDELPSEPVDCWKKDKCSEMESCEEAKYFLNHCQKKRLDRDKDGIPCEQLCKEKG